MPRPESPQPEFPNRLNEMWLPQPNDDMLRRYLGVVFNVHKRWGAMPIYTPEVGIAVAKIIPAKSRFRAHPIRRLLTGSVSADLPELRLAWHVEQARTPSVCKPICKEVVVRAGRISVTEANATVHYPMHFTGTPSLDTGRKLVEATLNELSMTEAPNDAFGVDPEFRDNRAVLQSFTGHKLDVPTRAAYDQWWRIIIGGGS